MRNIFRVKSMYVAFAMAIITFSLLLFECSCEDTTVPDGNGTEPEDKAFSGLCYGPYRDNEDPDCGVHPTVDELKQDLKLIDKLTGAIRTYGVTDDLERIPFICQQYGIDCYPGAWIGKFECENQRQISSLKRIAGQNLCRVRGLVVGNEVLLRKDLSEQELLELINEVKSATDLPVTTAEIWKWWLDHQKLAQAVDILFIHVYPYWDGIAIEEATSYVLEKWNAVKAAYPNKKIIIGETGWPSEGETRGSAVPSAENQKRYLEEFVTMADSNKIEYFYFEIFDENWKSRLEGETGSHWGIYCSVGSLKPHLIDLIPDSAQSGINREPRVVHPTEATLPLYVYKDGCDPLNGFLPSGWMGELADYMDNDTTVWDPKDIIDELSYDDPYSGNTCIRISYTPSIYEWGGIYWQFPVNNWGVYPGYDLSNALAGIDTVTLSFWVRGQVGGEKAEFKTGGINNTTLDYSDSYGPISTGVITLTDQWEKRTLVLTGEDLSMVIGGFCWVTYYYQNPGGSTIYLDEIIFEGMTVATSDVDK